MKPSVTMLRILILIEVVIIIVLATVIVNLNSKEQGVAHDRFVVVENYTFEVLSNPDEYGDMDVLVKNIKGECFDYKQAFNDVDAIKRFTYREMNTMISTSEYKAEWKINMHVKSGLVLYLYSKDELSIHDAANKSKVFESASNFFNIY